MKRKYIKFIIPIIVIALVFTVLIVKFDTIKQYCNKSRLQIVVIFGESLSITELERHKSSINQLIMMNNIQADKITIKDDVSEDDCFKIIESVIDNGCDLVFSVGNELEDYVVQSATEHPKVQYCIAESEQAITAGLDNLHSFALKHSEAKYLAGIVAGMKIKDLLDIDGIDKKKAVLGYVGTEENANNISAYTAFYLGAKSVIPEIKMKVKFIDDQFDEDAEQKVAKALIANGCVVLAQQRDSDLIVDLCEQNRIYYVLNNKTMSNGSDYALTSSLDDWSFCYSFAINCLINSEKLPNSWSGGIDELSVDVSEINKEAFAFDKNAEQATKLVSQAKEDLKLRKLYVFDIDNWKVNNKTIVTTLTDDLKTEYGGNEFIKDGHFIEYEMFAVPRFLFNIDEIEILK